MDTQKNKFGIILFLVLTTLLSCNPNKNKKTSMNEDLETIAYSEKSVQPLDFFNYRDTLIISFEGTDCGEWGGHKETIFLLRRYDYKYIARILIDEVPCDDIVETNGTGILNPEKRKISVDYTKVLETKDEKLFSDFIQRLMILYLKPHKPMSTIANYGDLYVVKNTDNSLYLKYWNNGNEMNTKYRILKNEVFGELKKMPVANR